MHDSIKFLHIRANFIQGIFDEDSINQIWGSLGLFISRQMRMGRGVNIPNFGIFTFGAPECVLNGVTNPEIRDKQLRVPVFIVHKDFVKGGGLKSGMYIDNHLRPYKNQTSGVVQVTIINFMDLSQSAGLSKDACQSGVQRMIRIMADRVRRDENVQMMIPAIGTFIVRNGVVGIKFQDSLVENTKGVVQKPIEERVQKGQMLLTAQTLSVLQFQNFRQTIEIDDSGTKYLNNKLGIEFNESKSQTSTNKTRPQTAFESQSMFRFPSAQKLNQIEKSSLFHQDRPVTSTPFNQDVFRHANDLSDIDYAMKRLLFWIRQNLHNSQDAFLETCNYSIGRSRDQKVRLNLQEFRNGTTKMDLNLNQSQLRELFNLLDYNKDGYIDFPDWSNTIRDDQNHLQYIKDVIYKRKLHTDDVLKTMGLSRENDPITQSQLQQGLQALDLSLNDYQAMKVAQLMIGNKSTISMKEIVDILKCYQEQDQIFDASWYKDILFKLKQKLKEGSLLTEFRQSCDYFDERNEGRLDVANFKTVLMRSGLNLSVNDINRLVRYLPQSDQNIDYFQFLRLIERVDKTTGVLQEANDVPEFADKLATYLQNNNHTYQTFLKAVKRWYIYTYQDDSSGSRVTSDNLLQFLKANVFTKTPKTDLKDFVEELDLDNDGMIQQDDLRHFILKYPYFNDIDKKPVIPTRNLTDYATKHGQTITLGTKSLYPLIPLPEEKVDKVLPDIRYQIQLKGMSYEDLFQFLDSNNDGFITITEFSQNIEQILKLSQYIKDGFFAFMDKLQIGMVDMGNFLKVMNQSCVTKQVVVREDNFEWEEEMIGKIRIWFEKNKFSVEDAFRVLDQKYDGEIGPEDLETFLVNHIKVKQDEITQAQIHRLFKLMDQFKRGRIALTDFQRFLCEDFSLGMNQTVMGHRPIENFSSFDWKINAKQQLGVVLTRRFPDLVNSFDVISGYQKSLIFKNFKEWINKNNALNGFDLTEHLMQQLFADLDPHQQGYLTETDWINAFEGHNWKQQMAQEIRETIGNNFSTMKKAFDFFVKQNESQMLDYRSFKENIDLLFPNRFIVQSDIEDMWELLNPKHEKFVDFLKFKEVIESKLPNFASSFDYKRPVTAAPLQSTIYFNEKISQTGIKTDLDDGIPPFQKETLVDKIRRYFRASNMNPADIFEQADLSGKGILTNMQFKNAMQQFNLALSNRESDEIQHLCGAQGYINWKEFLKLVAFRNSDISILERSKLKLRHLTNQIYTYMLSPKDAFRLFDTNRNGDLSFQQFQLFIYELCKLASEEVPPYAIIQDLFEYIDKRRDGAIDLTEWMDTFSKFEYQPQASIKRTSFDTKTISDVVGSQIRPYSTGGAKRVAPMMSASMNLAQVFKQERAKEMMRTIENVSSPNDSTALSSTIKKTQSAQRVSTTNNYIVSNDRFGTLKKQTITPALLAQWEGSKEFDKVINFVGRNRKYLFDMFSSLHAIGRPITYEVAQSIVEQLLRNGGYSVEEEKWPVLLKFAEKEGYIDFKFFLDVYKQRIQKIDAHPIYSHNNNNSSLTTL